MALSRVKTWIAGEILTASDLNAEFNNILNNALALVSPLTGNLDLDGKVFILDGDGDTSITADTDDQIDIALAGADDFRFTANTFTALAGSTIATDTIAETTAAGGVTVDGLLIKDGGIAAISNFQINDTSADHQYIFGVSELVADRTVTLPLLTGNDTFVFNDFAATLQNKTIDSANNTLTLDLGEGTLTGTLSEFNTAISDDNLTGQHTIWIPASGMTQNTTNGPAVGSVESATHLVMLDTLNFDDTTDEHAQFMIQMPKSWDEGTLVFQAVWTANATSGDVIWKFNARGFASDDAIDSPWTSQQTATDTMGGTAYDVMISPEATAFTPDGSPGAEELVAFRVGRDADAGGDTLTGDALLIGVKIHYTTSTLTDD